MPPHRFVVYRHPFGLLLRRLFHFHPGSVAPSHLSHQLDFFAAFTPFMSRLPSRLKHVVLGLVDKAIAEMPDGLAAEFEAWAVTDDTDVYSDKDLQFRALHDFRQKLGAEAGAKPTTARRSNQKRRSPSKTPRKAGRPSLMSVATPRRQLDMDVSVRVPSEGMMGVCGGLAHRF